MAFTNAESRWFLGMLPEADSMFSAGDAGLFLRAYMYGSHISRSVGGTLTPTGVLALQLELHRALGGAITPTGDLTHVLSAFRSLSGGLVPSGNLSTLMTFVQALGGTLDLTGDLTLSNPLWLLIDDIYRWMGEWDVAYTYGLNDVVLYKTADGGEWHVFVSKITHNTGNTPTTEPTAWRRLYQERLE